MTPAAEAIWHDVRSVARTYRRAPGVALLITLSLGVAIGANTVIFSLLHALALRDLPVRNPESLVLVSTVSPEQGQSYLTFPMFRELLARQEVLSSVTGSWGTTVVSFREKDVTAKALVWAATGNLYQELGVQPAAGRLLIPADMLVDPPAAASVAVLGHGFWQRHYRGDASVVGRTIELDGAAFTVVGVASAGFTGFALATEPDVTIPLTATPLLTGGSVANLTRSASRSVRMVGRLRPGATVAQTRAQLETMWPSVREAAIPATYTGARRTEFLSIGLEVSSAAKGIEPSLRRRYVQPLSILLGIASVVLLIACTNVASLLLSRASMRRHDFGVHLALGGSRWRVARQLLTEGVMLALAGAGSGIVLAYWACPTITGMVFAELTVPAVFDGRPDATVIALAVVVAVAIGIVCSALPAWRATKSTTTEAQNEGRTFSASGRTGKMLVGAQLALSLVLLTTAGVLMRSLSELRALDTGIDRSAGVVVAYPGPSRPGAYDGLDNDTYYRQLLERLEALPGVERASVSLLKPGAGGGFREPVFRAEGAADAAGITVTRSPVAPGFFAAVGIPVTQGRDFEWRDNSSGSRVTILSQSLARRLFGNTAAVGQRVRIGVVDQTGEALEVIGVVADARLYNLKSPDVLAAYTPALQDPNPSYKCLVVRGDNVSVAELKVSVESLGREEIGNVVTLQSITDQSLLVERLTALMSRLFGSIVLLLAGIGLFGLISYGVTQRRREIGIRVALGAGRNRVLRDIVVEGLLVTFAGVLLGGLGALVAVRAVKPLLYGVDAADPMPVAIAATILVALATIASSIPASKAARIDPAITLRGN